MPDSERLGIDQHERDARRRGTAIHPGVIGAALHHHIARAQFNG
jgi:hypothetical protein